MDQPEAPDGSRKASFTDVLAGHWAYSYVEQAVGEGWIAGSGAGTFGADDTGKVIECAELKKTALPLSGEPS